MHEEMEYVVDPTGRLGGPLWLWRRRGLLASLTLREIQVRYRQALLGAAWALLQPLALVVVTTLVFHRFLAVESDGGPYPLFAFLGLVPWSFFNAAVTYAVPSLVTNADLVRKIWFPREALPLACVGAVLLDLAIGLVLGLVWLGAEGTSVGLHWAWIPLLLALLVTAAAAVGLLGAAVTVFFRDVKHALPLLLQALFFATPIAYPLATVPVPWRRALVWNPLSAVVEGLRDVLLRGRGPDPAVLVPGATVAVLLLVVAWVVFTAAERRFADVV